MPRFWKQYIFLQCTVYLCSDLNVLMDRFHASSKDSYSKQAWCFAAAVVAAMIELALVPQNTTNASQAVGGQHWQG